MAKALHAIDFLAQPQKHPPQPVCVAFGDEPFLLLLGDHLYASDTEASCSRQIIDVYERTGQSVVGVYTATIDLDTDPTWKN